MRAALSVDSPQSERYLRRRPDQGSERASNSVQSMGRRGRLLKGRGPWLQCLDGTLKENLTQSAKYHCCSDTQRKMLRALRVMLAALEGRDVGQCVGCGYDEDEAVIRNVAGARRALSSWRQVNCRGFCRSANEGEQRFWPELAAIVVARRDGGPLHRRSSEPGRRVRQVPRVGRHRSRGARADHPAE